MAAGGAPNTPPTGPQPSAIQTLPLEVEFTKVGFGPATPFYVTPNDTLVFRVWSSLPGLVIGAIVRVQRPGGEVANIKVFVSPTGNRVATFNTIALTEGFLIAALVGVTTGTPKRGQCYCLLEVNRGGIGGDDSITLISGYNESTSRTATWPAGVPEASISGRGALRSITGTLPAAGAEINETVPTNARWILKSITTTLTTSATVITRTADLILDDGVNALLALPPGTTQAASLATRYNAGSFGAFIATDTQNTQWLAPAEIVMGAGYRFRTSTGSLQVGDQWSAPQYLVEEWIED